MFAENERLLEVTGSHVHCDSGNISEMVQDRQVITTHHKQQVSYGLSIRDIFNDLEWPRRSFAYCKANSVGSYRLHASETQQLSYVPMAMADTTSILVWIYDFDRCQ